MSDRQFIQVGANISGGGDADFIPIGFSASAGDDPIFFDMNIFCTSVLPTTNRNSSRVLNFQSLNDFIDHRGFVSELRVEEMIADARLEGTDFPHNFWTELLPAAIDEHLSHGAFAYFGPMPPTNAREGRLWLNEGDARLYARYPQPGGDQAGVWIDVGVGGAGGSDVLSVAEVDAQGTTQAGAQPVSAGFTAVVGGAGGVRWTGVSAGLQCLIYNGTDDQIAFYPPVNASINDNSVNVPLYINPNATGYFVGRSPTQIVSVP